MNVSILSAVAAVGLFAGNAMADIAAFTAPSTMFSPVNYQAGTPVDLGNVFLANSNFSVSGLGIYYNPALLTLSGTEDVGLYNSSGVLLASAVVPTSGTPVNNYIFASIAPVALTAGQTYTVVSQVNQNPWAYGPVPQTVPMVTFLFDDYNYTNTLAYPNASGGSGPAYYGPNFEIAPEPMYFGVLGVGLGILALIRRRRVSTE